jgi:hypothetical protein
MLIVPQAGFNYVTGNGVTTRPSASFGALITPGNNTYGNYVELVSDTDVTKDCYGIRICISSIGQSNNAKDSLCTIGIDTSGGTSYVDFISHLLCANASLYVTANAGGVHYYFPVFIPAGTAIAAKGSVNNATVGNQRVAVWLYGAPDNPGLMLCGSGVETIGVVTGSSCGTTVTSGTTSEGAWTSLGTSAKPCFWWQQGLGVNTISMGSNAYHAELSYGDGTNNKILVPDQLFAATSSETLCNIPSSPFPSCAPAGSTIYGRLQYSGSTPDSNLSMAAYGVY